MSSDLDLRLRESLEELDRYLADQVAPLLVTDSVEMLLDYPPELTAGALHAWSLAQMGGRGGNDTLADYLFHAIKKIQLFEEFNLLPADRFAAFLSDVAERLLEFVSPGERERLEEMLAYLRQAKSATTPTIDHLHRAQAAGGGRAGGPETPTTPLTDEERRSLRRFSLLLDRLDPGSGFGSGDESFDSARQLLVLAASGATSSGDLETRMSRLRTAGIGPAVVRDLVKSLAQAIPDWVVRRGNSVESVQGESVEAVRRVVRLAGDGARTLERWKELLRAAAENFNQGAYGRAVTLLDLADQMVRDREVEQQVADIARASGHEAFDTARVLQATADPQSRDIVRRLIEFFTAWSIPELLDALVYQPDSKRRKLLLALLEVWGEQAHKPVLERLASAVAENSRDPNVWWYLRNLVYLLHRLPRTEDVDPRHELELVAPFSELGFHPSFQRESIALLGQLPNGIGASILIQRLAEAERAVASGGPPHDEAEMRKILNSLAAALVRCGSSAARRALVEHALSQRPGTGESSERLRELANVDLSGDREVLPRLLEAIRSLQPVKVLGFVVSRNERTLSDVVRALASTSDAAARSALVALAERFPDREFGRLAASGGVESSGEAAPEEESEPEEFLPAPPPRPKPSLTGDLEVFGLPGLLQSLQQSEASGRLVLRRSDGGERAALDLGAGRLAGCRCGILEGEAAFYQIFEAPEPGTFEFVRATTPSSARGGADLMAVLMEGMRRFDEFQRLRALVPDRARLAATGQKPTAPAGEVDGEMVRRVWTRIRSGATTADCEQAARVDSYRTRALLAHWLEEGALRLEP